MQLYTIQVAKWRKAKILDVEFLDTTVKTGTSIFAPTWEIVRAVKSGDISEEQYTAAYRRLMAKSYTLHREEWLALLRSTTPVAVACFCPAGAFCHRLLLKRFFERLCEQHGIPFEYKGELT